MFILSFHGRSVAASSDQLRWLFPWSGLLSLRVLILHLLNGLPGLASEVVFGDVLMGSHIV